MDYVNKQILDIQDRLTPKYQTQNIDRSDRRDRRDPIWSFLNGGKDWSFSDYIYIKLEECPEKEFEQVVSELLKKITKNRIISSILDNLCL